MSGKFETFTSMEDFVKKLGGTRVISKLLIANVRLSIY